MSSKLDDQARAACKQTGIVYGPVPADGRWHPVDLADDPRGRGDGRIKLFPDQQGGIAWNHKTGAQQTFFINGQGNTAANPEERIRIKAEQERRQREQKARQDKTARRARAIWQPAQPAPLNQLYLTRKKLNNHPLKAGGFE